MPLGYNTDNTSGGVLLMNVTTLNSKAKQTV